MNIAFLFVLLMHIMFAFLGQDVGMILQISIDLLLGQEVAETGVARYRSI